MKPRRLLGVICLGALLCGCDNDPMTGDYEVPLTGKYRLIRTSAEDVEVVSITPELHRYVPAKVIGIAWNTSFIIAKQQKLKPRGDFPGDTLPVVAPGQFAYWIIDIQTTNCLGPLTESDYLTKVKSLGLEQLQIQDVSKLKQLRK